MGKILGLDLGENSIGWAIVDSEKREIIDMGSRVFQRACRRKERRSRNRRRIVIKTINNKKQTVLILNNCFEFIRTNTIRMILFCLFIMTGALLLMNLHDWQFWFNLSFTVLITFLGVINNKQK
jgi:hypothetical protein